MPWIRICPASPYFEDENGSPYTPIGQNDAVTWPGLRGLFRNFNPDHVDGYLADLSAHGVNCLRMMMEYCHTDNRYLEKPAGKFQLNMIRFWDAFFLLCEKHKIRVLITPFDTFWMARRWKFHPYNKLNGGPVASKGQWLKSDQMLAAIKTRFDFFIERWGGNGAIFGWDLWNEVSPLHAGRSIDHIIKYIEQISSHIRAKELALFSKSHLQTVSVFAPLLLKHNLNYIIFRHPTLDFATTHFYDAATIDNPRNTHSPARMTGNLVQNALENTENGRPFLDSEHGPIAYFRKHGSGLLESFDDQYFLYMQWAHIASGGAGGGMRWPYRHPHVLTQGMRSAQLNLSHFAKRIDWPNFRRVNLNGLIIVEDSNLSALGCGDESQAIVWVFRTKLTKSLVPVSAENAPKVSISIPYLKKGFYSIVLWNTLSGPVGSFMAEKGNQNLRIAFDMPDSNLALAIVELQGGAAI